MKIKIKVEKKVTLSLDDLGKLLKMKITNIDVNYSSADMRGEPCGEKRIVITSSGEEEHEV